MGSTLTAFLLAEVAVRLVESFSTLSASEVAARLDPEPADQEVTLGRRSLRGLVRASDQPDRVYELVPGLRGSFLGQPFSINSEGLRDHETPVGKPEGVFRIVGLGDSVMFGWGVAQDESYLALVEAELARRAAETGGPTVEVLNFGVPGYNTAMEVATFEHQALAYDPDLVVIHFVGNDLDLPRFLLRPKSLWTLRHSFLVDLLRARLGRADDAADGRLLGSGLKPLSDEERERVRDQYEHMVGEAGVRRSMARLARLARERDVPVLILALAGEGDPWSLVSEVAEENGFEPVFTMPHQGAYLEQQGLPPEDQSWIDTFWLTPNDGHPNALTHRLIAQALLERLPVPTSAAPPDRPAVDRPRQPAPPPPDG